MTTIDWQYNNTILLQPEYNNAARIIHDYYKNSTLIIQEYYNNNTRTLQ